MRIHGSFQYGEDAEKRLMKIITSIPKNTRAVTKEARMKYFPKIGRMTVTRMLFKMKEEGKIRFTKRNKKEYLWQKYE